MAQVESEVRCHRPVVAQLPMPPSKSSERPAPVPSSTKTVAESLALPQTVVAVTV